MAMTMRVIPVKVVSWMRRVEEGPENSILEI
jgi:hypothetical protein